MALGDFYLRLRRRQLLNGLSYSLPMTQRELGDYVGMTSIHVNRTLRSLREARLLVVEKGVVMMLDLDRLMRLGGMRQDERPIALEFAAGPHPGRIEGGAGAGTSGTLAPPIWPPVVETA
jgi:DNA-binding Lrp family transcriptional regulator